MAESKFSPKLDLDLGNDIQLDKYLDFENFKKQFLTNDTENNDNKEKRSPKKTNLQNVNINTSVVKTPVAQKRTSSFIVISKYLNDKYTTVNNNNNNGNNNNSGKTDNISSLLVKVGDFFSKKTTEKETEKGAFVPTNTSNLPSAVIINILVNFNSSNDLFNAALVCKRWATIALPLLYSKVHIKSENNFKICLKMKKCNKGCQICSNNNFIPIPLKYKGLIQELIVSITHIDINKLNSTTPITPIYKSNNKNRLSLQSTLSNSSYLSNSSSNKLNSSKRDSVGSTLSNLSNSLYNFPINEEEDNSTNELTSVPSSLAINTTSSSSSSNSNSVSLPILSPDDNTNVNSNSSLSELLNLQLNTGLSSTSSSSSSINMNKRSSLLQNNYSFQSDQLFEEHIINCAMGGNLKVLKLLNISLPNLNAMLKYIPTKQLKHLEVTTIHKRTTLEINSLLNYLKKCDSLTNIGLGFCTNHCSCWYDDNAKSLVHCLAKNLPPNLKSLRIFCNNTVTRDTMMVISQRCPKLENLDLTEAWFELEEEEEEEENNNMNESFERLSKDECEDFDQVDNNISRLSKKGFQFSNLKYFGCRGNGSLTTTKTVLNLISSAPNLCNLNLDSPNEMALTSTNTSQSGSTSLTGNRNSMNSNNKIVTHSGLTMKLFETILTHGNTESWKTLFLGPHLRSCSLGNLHCIALFSHLEILQLSWVATDTLLNEITEQCENLKILDISYSNVTDKGLKKAFIDHGYGKHLEWLGIHGCNQITNDGKLLLISEMPKLYGILTEKVALYWINNHFELRGWRGVNGYKQYII